MIYQAAETLAISLLLVLLLPLAASLAIREVERHVSPPTKWEQWEESRKWAPEYDFPKATSSP